MTYDVIQDVAPKWYANTDIVAKRSTITSVFFNTSDIKNVVKKTIIKQTPN
jgi:hypothetical protein